MGKLFMHFVPQYIFECYYDDLAYEQKKRAIPGRIFLIIIAIYIPMVPPSAERQTRGRNAAPRICR